MEMAQLMQHTLEERSAQVRDSLRFAEIRRDSPRFAEIH